MLPTYDFSTMTKADVSRAIGVSLTTVSAWISKGCPRQDSGRMDLREVVAWLVDRAGTSTSSPDRERWIRARADREEMRVLKEQGELIPIPLFRRLIERLMVETRGRLIALPGRAAPMVIGSNSFAEVTEILSTLVDEALGELSTMPAEEIVAGAIRDAGFADDPPAEKRRTRCRTPRKN
jgi:hypothetical protein